MTAHNSPIQHEPGEIAEIVDRLRRQRDAARKQADIYLEALRDDYPLVVLAARWPGYVTCLGIGALLGLLLADLWEIWG